MIDGVVMDQVLLLQVALAVAGVFVVYALLSRGLFLSAERQRSRALDLAVDLDASELPDIDKQIVRMTLGELHSSRAAWRMALSIVYAVLVGWASRRYDDQVDVEDSLTKETAAKFNGYRTAWIFATMANSLGATIVFVLFSLIGRAFSISTDKLKSAISIDHDHHGNGMKGMRA